MDKYKHLLNCFKKVWDLKEENNLLSMISKKIMKEGDDKKLNAFEEEGYTDRTNTILFIPKKESIKLILRRFDNEDCRFEAGKLNMFLNEQTTIEKKKEVMLGIFTLKFVLPLLKGYEYVKFRIIKSDSPMLIETEDFLLVVAPRVEEMK